MPPPPPRSPLSPFSCVSGSLFLLFCVHWSAPSAAYQQDLGVPLNLPPLYGSGNATVGYLSISVTSIRKISPADSSFTIDCYLTTAWRDDRMGGYLNTMTTYPSSGFLPGTEVVNAATFSVVSTSIVVLNATPTWLSDVPSAQEQGSGGVWVLLTERIAAAPLATYDLVRSAGSQPPPRKC